MLQMSRLLRDEGASMAQLLSNESFEPLLDFIQTLRTLSQLDAGM